MVGVGSVLAGHARQAQLLDHGVELDLADVQRGGHPVVAVDDPVVVAELDQLDGRQRLELARWR